jgi:DNA (cytosine-5)-methyltransferase 1
MNFTFSDLFAGIGGMRLGFESQGGECVLTCENNKSAQLTYNLNFKKNVPSHLFHDDILTLVDSKKKIPYHDILLAGFPCQPYSIAGLRKGLSDTRGGDVFTSILKILDTSKPKAFLLENVKNMKSHDKGNTLEYMIHKLENCGYFTDYKILNSMEYANVPQNRERLFFVGFKDQRQLQSFNYPNKIKLTKTIHDCLEQKVVSPEFYYDDRYGMYQIIKKAIKSYETMYQWRRVYPRENKSQVCPTLTANMGSGGHNVPLFKTKYPLEKEKDIRKLTPRETANFQGFPKSFILPNIANSKLYHQFGNSVTVPLIKRIAKEMVKIL